MAYEKEDQGEENEFVHFEEEELGGDPEEVIEEEIEEELVITERPGVAAAPQPRSRLRNRRPRKKPGEEGRKESRKRKPPAKKAAKKKAGEEGCQEETGQESLQSAAKSAEASFRLRKFPGGRPGETPPGLRSLSDATPICFIPVHAQVNFPSGNYLFPVAELFSCGLVLARV